MNTRALFQAVGLAAACAAATPALAQSVDPAISELGMYGINRSNGELIRADLSNGSFSVVGTLVNTSDNSTMTGVEAAAYAPGFSNIYGFWKQSNGKSKLVYIDPSDATADPVGDDLEGGPILGAAAIASETAPCTVYAVQAEEVTPPLSITGSVNINPNNSPQNEFSMNTGTVTYTRDDLHANTVTDSDGVFYEGACTTFTVKPKGNGNQNGLIIDGEEFTLQNSNTYTFTGDMTVKVWNDQIHSNGKAMGKWWITVTDGTVEQDDEVETPHRLVTVCHSTGVVTELMVTTRAYTGLATTDGLTFYASFEGKLYALDPTAGTETLVGDTGGDNQAMAFGGTTLLQFNVDSSSLGPFDSSDGSSLGTPVTLTAQDLGAMVLFDLDNDPAGDTGQYD